MQLNEHTVNNLSPEIKNDLREIYRGAIDAINKNGWHQGDYVNYTNGSVCLVEALNKSHANLSFVNYTCKLDELAALSIPGILIDAANSYLRSLVGFVGDRNRQLSVYNDAPGRTKADIIILLEQATVSLKDEEDV